MSWEFPEGVEVKRHMVTRESMVEHHNSLVIRPIHDCNEPYAESSAVFDDNIKLWRFAVTEHHSSAPISHCPFCGDKLPFDSRDMEAYHDELRLEEETNKRKHEELMEHMRKNPSPDRDADDTPEYNPLKSP